MTKICFTKLFRFQILFVLLLAVMVTVGCSHKKTNRGHLYRCEWAFEHNRTPWIGCPPDSGCDDERGCGECCGNKKKGLLDCLKRDSGECSCSCDNQKNNKGFRRHCGLNPECTSKKPCCRTLGCGMWIDPADPNTFASLGNGAKACGLTPFCSPMKPCCLTPNCGRVTNQAMMNQQMLMLGNMGGGMAMPNPPMTTPVIPTPVTPKSSPEMEKKKTPTVAGPTGLLISRGIVPGVSTITTGGVVAAAGVATPVGVMTPSGVQMPNGMVNSNFVLRACAMPGCSAARPCGMTAGCGSIVPITVVSNNAMMLASALRTPGMAGNVMQAGTVPGYANGGVMTAHGIAVNRTGNGMLVNPVTGQPVSGLTMSGYPQSGYPPIGYTESGYSPGYPRYAGHIPTAEPEEEEESEPEAVEEDTKSQMPPPRFHPIPSKPTFQRSEGLPTPSRKTTDGKRAENSRRIFSDEALDSAIEQAYLEGMSHAMDEVEQELKAQSQELAKAQLQEKILNQAKKLQTQIESQKELEIQVLEMEKRQELAQRKTQAQARMLAEQMAQEKAAQDRALIETEMLKARLQRSQAEQATLRRSQQMQMAQTTIPTGFQHVDQSVAPVNYNADGTGKSVFASTMEFLKGSDEKPQKTNSLSTRVPYTMPQQSSAQQYRQPSHQYASMAPNSASPGLLQSAKSAGNNMVSAVSGAVSPLFAVDKPSPKQMHARPIYHQQPMSAQMQQVSSGPPRPNTQFLQGTPAPKTVRSYTAPCPPCPPCPPFYAADGGVNTQSSIRTGSKNVSVRSVPGLAIQDIEEEEIDFSDLNVPKKPPKMKTKPKKVIDVEDCDEEGFMIRQANYEERE